VIIDWKTGKSKPKDNLQLETYDALMSNQPDLPWMEHGGMAGQFTGLWVMLNPDAAKARPVQLVKTPQEMGAMYAEVERKILAGAFPANIQYNCRFCTMLPNCKTKSGSSERTRYYDTPEKDGVIPY
jgi:hypothetical protein